MLSGRQAFPVVRVLDRTTDLFLKLFGLNKLKELPDIAGFDPPPEFEQELRERLLPVGEAPSGLAGVATPQAEGGETTVDRSDGEIVDETEFADETETVSDVDPAPESGD
jgi:segregation and condensation protein B